MHYWVGNIPGTTISSSEGERIAVLGRDLSSTTTAAAVAALGDAVATTTVAATLGALGAVTASAAEVSNLCDGSASYVAFVSASSSGAFALSAANSGKVHFIGDTTENLTISTPTEAAGLNYKLVYVGGAEDVEDWIIDTGSNTNYFIGGLEHQDIDGELIATAYSTGTSKSILTLDKPGAGTEVNLLCDGTHWYIHGRSVSATLPVFSS